MIIYDDDGWKIWRFVNLQVLADMFTHNGSESVTESDTNLETSSYENAVKDFIHDEKQHLHNMNMISKVFLEKINIVLPINQNEVSQSFRIAEFLDEEANLTSFPYK